MNTTNVGIGDVKDILSDFLLFANHILGEWVRREFGRKRSMIIDMTLSIH